MPSVDLLISTKAENIGMLLGDILINLITNEFSQNNLVFEKKYRFPGLTPSTLKYNLLGWDREIFIFNKLSSFFMWFRSHCSMNHTVRSTVLEILKYWKWLPDLPLN